MEILSKFFKNNKKKEITNPEKRPKQEKHPLNTIFLENLPIPLVIVDKNKIIKEFNTLAKKEFSLKSNFNLTHIIRNPIFVNNTNVAIKRKVKKILMYI